MNQLNIREKRHISNALMEPVVQSMISANPELNFNLLFWFKHFCSTVCFKTLKNKSFIDPENICEKTYATS